MKDESFLIVSDSKYTATSKMAEEKKIYFYCVFNPDSHYWNGI